MSDPARQNGPLFGAIEAGGTKFLCAIGTPEGKILSHTRIPTTTPAETIPQVLEFFRLQAKHLTAIGLASFGPVQLNRNSPQYGFITNTPKIPWRNFDLAGAIGHALKLPIAFDTDVNAAALAETIWGSGQLSRSLLYVTVGTGIGGGLIREGAIFHGTSHPEMGHLLLPHDLARDPFPGACPNHGDCLEGLASGRAMELRWKTPPHTLPPDHPAWALEIDYLAKACMNWICTLVPETVTLGGGIMRPELFPPLRARVSELLNGYLETPSLGPSALGTDVGILGALALGIRSQQ